MNDQHHQMGLTLIEVVIWGLLLASIPLGMEVIRVNRLGATYAWTGFVRENNGDRVYFLYNELLYYKDCGQIVSISYVNTVKCAAVAYIVLLCAFFVFLSRRYVTRRESKSTNVSDN